MWQSGFLAPSMIAPRIRRLTISTLILIFLSLNASTAAAEGLRGRDLFGPRFEDAPHARAAARKRPQHGLSMVRRWNEIALNANALDHAPAASGIVEQPGPLRTARAFAIVHIAIFDAVNAIVGGHRSYTGIAPAPRSTSMDAAVAQAAHDTLVVLYKSQKADFDGFLREDLDRIHDGHAKSDGIALGKRAAAAILANRANDGSAHSEPLYGVGYKPNPALGKWRQDPITRIPVALGADWSKLVRPFVLQSADQFPVPPPPPLFSAEFAEAFNEVKRVGGCGDDDVACASRTGSGFRTETERTPEQTTIGIFWGYDGTPGLGTPPRLYNQIALKIAEQMRSNGAELARLLALVNVAMADAGLACWLTKYQDEFARPITAIREAAGYDNPNIQGKWGWTPLGAPASNLIGPNFTPPFPAYASGHATFGGALFQTLRNFYGTDHIAFSFVSDEFNGVTKDNTGIPRPRVSRSFRSLSDAEEENGQSRMYLGIHWAFDKTAGIAQGRSVADYVFEHAF